MLVGWSDRLVMLELIRAEALEVWNCGNAAPSHGAAKVLTFADRFVSYFGTISG